jgi:hypothetical protein
VLTGNDGERNFGLDSDGIFRVAEPQNTPKAAYLTLLRLWGLHPNPSQKEFDGLDIQQLVRQSGLSTYQTELDISRLGRLNYPVIVKGTWSGRNDLTYAVLVRFEDKQAIILDPIGGRKALHLDQLASHWKNEGTILWKTLPRISLPIPLNGPSTSVMEIQRALKAYGLYPGRIDGFWGGPTRKAIQFFQQKHGLAETGLFGMETYLVLSRELLKQAPELIVMR